MRRWGPWPAGAGPGGHRIDVLELGDAWAAGAIAQAMSAPDPGLRLPILPLPFLVLLQMAASRPQDLADVTRMLGVADAARAEVRAAVADFGSREDIEDLEQMIALGRLEHEP